MATFQEHINQSNNNLDYLSKINSSINDRWDWQVTVSFYCALHLINAHIVQKTTKNYLSHSQVSHAINPFNPLSVSKVDEETYLSYTKLFQLSRRARYLLNENFDNTSAVDIQPACVTYSKHFKKTVHHLNKIMDFMTTHHGTSFVKRSLKCIDLNNQTFTYFTIIQ